MSPQKIIIWIISGIGGAIGLFAPVGIVKWLLRPSLKTPASSHSSSCRYGASSSSPACSSGGGLE